MFKKPLSKNGHLSKHQILKHFIETADKDCISRYYFDPYFKNLPKIILQDYIKELSEEGYVNPCVRHVVLTVKAYSYLHDRRTEKFNKILSVLGRPVSYLLTWILGILSAVVVQYLIKFLGLNS